jgi:tetratricopeptide (TPR) repeat protein
LDNLGNAIVSEISHLSAQVEGLSESIASLHDSLNIGFSEVIRQLDAIYNLMAEVLPHPVVTEASDLYQIGVKMLRRGFHQEAERKLLEARDRDPSAFAVYTALGETYMEMERGANALNYFELAERNAVTADQRGYACLLQGRFLMKEEDYSGARRRFLRATAASPERAVVWYALAQCEGAAGQEAATKEALTRAIRLDANNFSRAIIDPYMTSVRSTVEVLCHELCREAYERATKAIAEVEAQIHALEKSDLSWYVPRSFMVFAQSAKEFRNSVHPERFLPCLKGPALGAALLQKIQTTVFAAQSNKADHMRDNSTEAKDTFGLGIGLGLLGGMVGCVVGGLSKGYTAGQGFTAGFMILVLTVLVFAGLKGRERRSRQFIEHKFKDS